MPSNLTEYFAAIFLEQVPKGARTPHILDLNLQKYYDIDRIVIYTGIPEPEKTEQEKGQAPGFWAMKTSKFSIGTMPTGQTCLIRNVRRTGWIKSNLHLPHSLLLSSFD